MKKYIGIMSGTSCDAIDACVVDFSNKTPCLLASHTETMPSDIRKKLLTMNQPGFSNADLIYDLDVQLGHCYAKTVSTLLEKNSISKDEIEAIGLHGQTIRHQPEHVYPHTTQIGDPNIVALSVDIPVIADFRRKDIANGGQGAPFAPIFHQVLFASDTKTRVAVNLGGIANITLLIPGKPVYGFDTGPANALMDDWIFLQQQKRYDDNGDFAKAGTVSNELLNTFLSDPYFQLPPPKSTGRDYFNLEWVNTYVTQFKLSPEDVQATLCELSSVSIADAIVQNTTNASEVIICGGGSENSYLLSRLKDHLQPTLVSTSDAYGIPPGWIEPMAFAWLAKERVLNNPVDMTTITGSKSATTLGAIYT